MVITNTFVSVTSNRDYCRSCCPRRAVALSNLIRIPLTLPALASYHSPRQELESLGLLFLSSSQGDVGDECMQKLQAKTKVHSNDSNDSNVTSIEEN